MINNELASINTSSSTTTKSISISYDGRTCIEETSEHVEVRSQVCEEESPVSEVHGGSISERLAALQRSGSENWKKRLGGKPPVLLKPDGPVMRVKDKPQKPTGERPRSLLDRIMMLGEAQDQWRNRVEDKDASQFTVAGKMVQVRYSPQSSPIISRKKYSPKPVQGRSKTTNIQDLSSYNSHSVPSSPYHLSKSQSSLITCSSSSELEKIHKITKVHVPKVDDESFTSFFKSVKEKITSSSFEISDEVFQFLSAETHELLSQRKEKLKFQRKHASSGNPLKLLASRADLKQDYEEVYRGVAERELQRMKIEKLAKGSSLALSALAGLASTEDFKRVALKKSASTQSSTENSISLLQVKGRRRAQVRLVESKGSSLNHGDSYVLVTPTQVYCWHGEFSNVIERVKAVEVSNLIQSTKDLGYKGQEEAIIIEEENESHSAQQNEFLDALSIKLEDIRVAGAPDEDELYEIAVVNTNAVYKLGENELIPYDELCGTVPKIEMLKPNMIYVFDFGPEMYVWCGKLAPTDLRKSAASLAKELWDQGYNYSECDINPMNASFDGPIKNQDEKRPSWGTFIKTSQHREPVLFKEKFFDWPNIHPLITQKNFENSAKNATSPTSISDVKPCDYKSLLENEVEEPDTILENSHIGRGLEYHDEKERRHFRISTVSLKMWHISEYGYKVLPEESWGQFHNSDSYVVRWQYMISNTGRTLKGGTSRHSFVGRKRWVYFFWQGENSSINEKGVSALMTVELNEEKGPHVRVISGKEPPCFLNLYRGQMVVYEGRREESQDEENEEPWKMFILRGDMKSEVVLHQVKLSKGSLRSRTSYALVNRITGKVLIWHGCKSASHSREFIKSSVEALVSKHPTEMHFSRDVELSVSEVEEGSEPEEFWNWSHENDEPYYSLSNSEHSYDFTPRLFLFDSMSGGLSAKEVVCPYFTKTHPCPFPLLQSDLKNASQPALFLLDNHQEVYVWQGWLPKDDQESENLTTGSAKLRLDVNRKLVMEIALQYCQGKNAEENPKAYVVHAGAEPLYFTNIFPQWTNWDVPENEELCKVLFVQEVLSQLSRDRYTLNELQQKTLPPGVDPLRLESYLTDSDFEEVLGMKKEEFYNMPSWKQTELKKSSGLF